MGATCPAVWHINGPTRVTTKCKNLVKAGRIQPEPHRLVPPSTAGEGAFTDRLSSHDTGNVYALLTHLERVCNRSNIEYIMDGGMLVGSMLHHGRIPWDDDFDVYIRDSDRAKVTDLLSTDGYVVTSAGRYDKLWSTRLPRVKNDKSWNWPFVDIGWLQENATHAWERRIMQRAYRKNVYPRDWLFPITRRPYGPLTLSAPHRAATFLTYRFGPNWAQTCVSDFWDHKLEKWRPQYVGNRQDRVACASLNVNLVHRHNITNDIHKEALVNTRSGRAFHTKRFYLESVLEENEAGHAASDANHGVHSVKCELTWLTASTTQWSQMHMWDGVCHKHLPLNPSQSSRNFWRDRWRAVLQYVREHTSLRYVVLTDIGDTHLNPFTADEIIDQFRLVASGRSVLLSTEMTCWIGRVCSAEAVQRFKTVFPTTGRFLHSQYMGTRDGLLHMLSWGANTTMDDDMHMIYEYALRHAERIALDTNQTIFGSFANAQRDDKGKYMCWSGKCSAAVTKCYRYGRRICATLSAFASTQSENSTRKTVGERNVDK